MKKKRPLLIVGLSMTALIIALAVIFSGRRDEREVTVEEVVTRTVTESVTASGKIQPETEVKIQSEVSGQIIELPVKEGDIVAKGQLLVKINPDLYTAALNRAEAALNGARSNLASAKARLIQAEAQFSVQELNYGRMKKLFADKAISEAEMDNARTTWETAKAEVTAAKETIRGAEFSIQSAQASSNEAADNLRRTTILAPMSGTVTALTKEPGETVLGNNMMSGDVIMKISAMNAMEVKVEVNESDIVRIESGDTVYVEVDAYRDEKFTGIVSEIGNTALNATGSAVLSMDQVTNFPVKIHILPESYSHYTTDKPASYSPFRPGMSATVEILTDKAVDVITVPLKAITAREDTTSGSFAERMKNRKLVEDENAPLEPYTVVFVLDEASGSAQLRVVKTGIQDDRFIHVVEGLKSGEKVITGPYEEVSRLLHPGDKVTVRKAVEDEKKE